ncbi:MAG: hypothetical protein CM15mP98_01440 [Paracoccaceae bacterium]|nr:MAG: hypothetical protein CM15mP98_01440 [Paracoccaceae bacterium]
MNKGQFLLKLKKFNEKISVGRQKNFIMVCRVTKDRYIFYGSTLTLISIINEKYFVDGIIKIKSLFENLEDEPTKKSQCQSKYIIDEFSRNIKVLYQ